MDCLKIADSDPGTGLKTGDLPTVHGQEEGKAGSAESGLGPRLGVDRRSWVGLGMLKFDWRMV
jgi:hypothetical protein